jgi:hypothetical protein
MSQKRCHAGIIVSLKITLYPEKGERRLFWFGPMMARQKVQKNLGVESDQFPVRIALYEM